MSHDQSEQAASHDLLDTPVLQYCPPNIAHTLYSSRNATDQAVFIVEPVFAPTCQPVYLILVLLTDPSEEDCIWICGFAKGAASHRIRLFLVVAAIVEIMALVIHILLEPEGSIIGSFLKLCKTN